eukprot:3515829-Rhodomonas_salina.2
MGEGDNATIRPPAHPSDVASPGTIREEPSLPGSAEIVQVDSAMQDSVASGVAAHASGLASIGAGARRLWDAPEEGAGRTPSSLSAVNGRGCSGSTAEAVSHAGHMQGSRDSLTAADTQVASANTEDTVAALRDDDDEEIAGSSRRSVGQTVPTTTSANGAAIPASAAKEERVPLTNVSDPAVEEENTRTPRVTEEEEMLTNNVPATAPDTPSAVRRSRRGSFASEESLHSNRSSRSDQPSPSNTVNVPNPA